MRRTRSRFAIVLKTFFALLNYVMISGVVTFALLTHGYQDVFTIAEHLLCHPQSMWLHVFRGLFSRLCSAVLILLVSYSCCSDNK